MEIIRHLEDRPLAIPKPILTMGNFDGIHLGHQALLERVIQDAKERSGCSVVLTFEPHPLSVLAPERAPKLILTHKDKMRLLQSFGVDVVIIQEFNAAFANIEPQDFVRSYLIDQLRLHKIWVGRDVRFGRRRKGRVEDMVLWSREGGFEVGIVEPIKFGDVRVSSSRIRELIGRGDVVEAGRFLGRYHFVSGRVTPGQRRGRQLGFPTANISPRTEVIPPNGIYATLLEAGGRGWKSVTSIGVNPTFGDGPRTIETYIFDFNEELYGQSVRLSFVSRIRDEKKFASPELLIEQIKEDVLSAQRILDGVGSDFVAC